jgi:hypothetical protein
LLNACPAQFTKQFLACHHFMIHPRQVQSPIRHDRMGHAFYEAFNP